MGVAGGEGDLPGLWRRRFKVRHGVGGAPSPPLPPSGLLEQFQYFSARGVPHPRAVGLAGFVWEQDPHLHACPSGPSRNPSRALDGAACKVRHGASPPWLGLKRSAHPLPAPGLSGAELIINGWHRPTSRGKKTVRVLRAPRGGTSQRERGPARFPTSGHVWLPPTTRLRPPATATALRLGRPPTAHHAAQEEGHRQL